MGRKQDLSIVERSPMLAFLKDQVANAESAADHELAEHLGSEGVPAWLARFYVARHRPAALATPLYDFHEPDAVVDACVHLAIGYASDLTMYDMTQHAEELTSHAREIVEMVEELQRLRAEVAQLRSEKEGRA